jgi:DHA1 family bicyclomycin/chloramphenicol resistance-like MFS transporter
MPAIEKTPEPPQQIQAERRAMPTRIELVIIIAGLMALNAMAIDIMLPGLSVMAAGLGLDAREGAGDNRQQLIIFAFVLGFGLPQVVWGPLTDRFGRRGPMFIAIGGYAVTSLACSVVHDFNALLMMRFIQGVFASGARICATSLVRDLFAGRAMASFMSLTMTIFMIVPIIAPLIGQAILHFAPWEAIFIWLAVFALLVGALAGIRLPETLPRDARRPLNAESIAGAYAMVFTSKVTLGYMCASGIIFGALFAFISSSEQVLRVVFKAEHQFALWFGLIAAGLAVSNFTNSRLVMTFGMRRMSHFALIAFIVLAAINLALTMAFGENLWRFAVLFTLNFAFFGMMGSNFNAIAMEPLGKIAGTASAAYGFATTVFSSLVGYLIGQSFDGTTKPLMAGYIVIGLVTLAIVLITERGRLFRVTA